MRNTKKKWVGYYKIYAIHSIARRAINASFGTYIVLDAAIWFAVLCNVWTN